MSKGQIFHSTFSEYTDPHTGTVVKRLTDPSILSHHMYFYNRMTTSDGQYLLICQKRDEGRQLYTLNLHNGEDSPDHRGRRCRSGQRHVFT